MAMVAPWFVESLVRSQDCRLMKKQKKPRGNCYVTCEALFYLLGGKKAGWIPHTVRHEGDVHWYLVRDGNLIEGDILDPTAVQFKTPPPYHKGRGRGFLTKKPSKRAKALMKLMLWQI